MALLFSYGTLQYEKVQLETYGRKLKGEKDSILKFRLEQVEITDPIVLSKSEERFHPIAIPTGIDTDFVEGVVFEITEEELKATDEYEVADYKRVKASLQSGKTCWVYIANN